MFLVAITDLSGKSKVILQIELILSRYKKNDKTGMQSTKQWKKCRTRKLCHFTKQWLKKIIWWMTKLLSIETEFIGYISV